MSASLMLGSLLLGAAGSAEASSAHGCRPLLNMKNFVPRGAGPATLIRVHCLAVPGTPFTFTPPIVSPDGRRAFVHQYRRGVSIYDLATGAAITSVTFDPTFLRLGVLSGPTVFGWAADSRSVWGADQQLALPSHFAKSPLQPVRIWTSAKIDKLQLVNSAVRDLDGLRWLDGRGKALALFDARGGFYRPERPVAKPVLAFVDVPSGRVEQMAAIAEIPGYPGGPVDLAYASIRSISTTKLPNGRSRIIIQWSRGGWTEWTQGGGPRRPQLGYDGKTVQTALTKSGQGILVSSPLSATGVICEIWSRQKCPPPTPTTGLIAALHSFPSGKRIWAINGTATTFGGSYPTPAISPDNRFAIIGIPSKDEYRIAFISMANGRILQTVRPPWTSEVAVSFSPDSSLAFVSGGSTVLVYKNQAKLKETLSRSPRPLPATTSCRSQLSHSRSIPRWGSTETIVRSSSRAPFSRGGAAIIIGSLGSSNAIAPAFFGIST